jgi:uroporphyrinogen-III synthase
MTKILLKHKTENFLVPVSDVHKENIPALMDELRLKYTKVVFYRTVANEVAKEIPDLKEFDNVVVEPFYKVHFERYAVYWPINY